jgi:Ni/Fe-hydrogenase subunit HybB-like protein
VLATHFIASLVGSTTLQKWLMIAGIPLSILTAVYTAYLFAQAKARDMWQNPLLPPHLFVQAILLGSAVLELSVVVSRGLTASDDMMSGVLDTVRLEVVYLNWLVAIFSLVHLLMVCGEVSLTHPTAHARVAIWEMMRGRYRSDFWFGTILSFLGGLLAWLAILGVISFTAGVAAAPLALVGLVLYENAYVQAGQSVPLA